MLAQLDALSLPLRDAVHVDGWVLGFTVLAAVATGLLFGFTPAFCKAPGIAIHDSLKDANRGSSRRPETALDTDRRLLFPKLLSRAFCW